MSDMRKFVDKVDAKKHNQGLRYLAVVIGGFVVDLSISWTTHQFLGLDLVVAATLGFIVATCLSYFAHEFWTFRSPGNTYSTARLTKFAIGSGVTLATRLFLVALSAPLSELPFDPLARLLFAFGGSLAVGFLINRLLIFASRE